MLVATRDHQPRTDLHAGHAPPRSRLSRFTGVVQLLGSLIGIPIGLVSAYSVYHSNFSAEASCQSLRANIIGMLDKKADAATLRALVRRDVVSFERDCAAVDADAVTAFKTLLAEPVPARPPVKAEAKSAAKAAVAKVEAKVESKVELKAEAKADKIEVVKKASAAEQATPAAAEPKDDAASVVARRDAPEVDARWLASVREVLQNSSSPSPASDPVTAAEPPRASGTEAAPPLPPPDMVRAAPAPVDITRRVERTDDHPVPPAPIPNVVGRSSGAD
jgi:hypothetical protein